MKKVLLLALILTAQGCVTPVICTKAGAFDMGRQHALAGKPADFDNGSVCEGEDLQTFRMNFQKGYDAGLQLLCSAQNASDDGRDAGLQGQNLQGLPIRYQVCTQDHTKLEKTFMTAYRQGLDEHCSLDTAKNRGEQAGRMNQASVDVDAVYISCPQTQRRKLKQAYQTAYLNGLRAYCQPAQHIDSIRTRAQTSSQASHDPQTFGSCAQHFPDLLDDYHALFYQERDAVVQRLCTYENGLNQGRSDAAKSNHRRRDIPEFCDENAASSFLRAYNRGWTDQKREICRSENYYDKGFQDAMNGLSAEPHFPELCPGDYYRDMRDRYQAGYDRGRRHAPHRPHHQEAVDDVVKACGLAFSFDSDKLECIKQSQKLRFHAAELVEACTQAFSFHSDRMKCISSSAHCSYNPLKLVRICQQSNSLSSDLEKCISTVKDTRYEPSHAINACNTVFSLSSDRQECWDLIARQARDPSARIHSCKQSFTFSSDILKCIRM